MAAIKVASLSAAAALPHGATDDSSDSNELTVAPVAAAERMETDAEGTAAGANATSGSSNVARTPRPRTLIHFKKNASHAVSYALAQLGWSEVRVRLPNSSKDMEGPSAARSAAAAAAVADDDGDDDDAAMADESSSTPASRASPVDGGRKKVKQPRSLLLNLASYPATAVTVAGVPVQPVPPAASAAARRAAASAVSSSAPLQWDVAWVDLLSEREYAAVGPLQRLNQFPQMHKLSKKKFLALHLNAMREREPEEYSFYPRSWVLPAQRADLARYYAEVDAAAAAAAAAASRAAAAASSAASSAATPLPSPVLIVKPDFACEGRGIYLVSKLSEVESSRAHPVVVQQYVGSPLLLNGCKYDLRLYVLVLSVHPQLSLFLFDEGLTRVCAEAYSEPSAGSVGSAFQHLTNYALNKAHASFVPNEHEGVEDEGNKWSLQALFAKLRQEGVDTGRMWQDIADVIVKAVVSSYGSLLHSYRTAMASAGTSAAGGSGGGDDGGACFQFLGFDILLVQNPSDPSRPRPVLIEINRNCSLRCDTPLDRRVKTKAVAQTLRLADPRAPYRHRSREQAQRERERLRALSGRDYTEAQREMMHARANARMRYEDDMLRRFAEEEGGGFHRIFPLVPADSGADVAAAAAAADDAPSAASGLAPPTFRSALMPPPERAATYERLRALSMQLHAEGITGVTTTSSAAAAAGSSHAAASTTAKSAPQANATTARRTITGRATASSSIRAARAAANRAAAANAAAAGAGEGGAAQPSDLAS